MGFKFKMLAVILLSSFLSSCNAQESKIKKEMSFNSINEQAETIKKYHQALLKATGEEKLINELIFFKAFPNSFDQMQKLFGFDDKNGAGPLYDYEISNDMELKGVISTFSKLTSIDKKDYYTKYINICVNGNWKGDNIAEGFGLDNKLYRQTEDVIEVLKLRSEKEIRSVFRFLFDGPHPDNRMESFKTIYDKLKSVDSSMAKLLKQEYEKLLAEDDGQGH